MDYIFLGKRFFKVCILFFSKQNRGGGGPLLNVGVKFCDAAFLNSANNHNIGAYRDVYCLWRLNDQKLKRALHLNSSPNYPRMKILLQIGAFIRNLLMIEEVSLCTYATTAR